MAASFQQNQSPTLRKYRELLGVSTTATEEDLKKAYYQLAFLYHPDRNPDPQAPAHFQKIREAYDVLTDSAKVESLQKNHLKEKLFDTCVEGLQVSFGAFFGYRIFTTGEDLIPRSHRIGKDPGPDPQSLFQGQVYVEEDRSILDDPAFDSIEVVYAGRFSKEDEERLKSDIRMTSQSALPWVVLNNTGILDFINGDYAKALKCYEELNRRIRNNIIFMYREALCHIVIGFQKPKRTLWGTIAPDKKEIQKGIQLLKKCIQTGENRPVGKQKCLVIKKLLADVLEKTGRQKAAKTLWQEIFKHKPQSVEASLKSGDLVKADELLRKKKKSRVATSRLHRALLPHQPTS